MARRKGMIKDANAQLQAWNEAGVSPAEQARQVEGWMSTAKPYVVVWAEEIGGIRNLNEKTEALNEFFRKGVAVLSPEDRAGFKAALCDAAGIRSTEWNERMRTLNGHVKGKAKDEDDEPVFVTGGWVMEHFIGLEYDPEQDRTFMAVRFPDGRVEDRLERVKIGEQKYVPMPANNIIRKRVILLPTEMTELQDEADLLFAIRAHNARYFDFGSDETFEQLCMIYPFFTYLAR